MMEKNFSNIKDKGTTCALSFYPHPDDNKLTYIRYRIESIDGGDEYGKSKG